MAFGGLILQARREINSIKNEIKNVEKEVEKEEDEERKQQLEILKEVKINQHAIKELTAKLMEFADKQTKKK